VTTPLHIIITVHTGGIPLRHRYRPIARESGPARRFRHHVARPAAPPFTPGISFAVAVEHLPATAPDPDGPRPIRPGVPAKARFGRAIV
jgi:hypothetical protein